MYKKCQNAALCTPLCAAVVWPKGGNRGQPERTSPVMLRLKLSVIDGNLPGKAGLAHFSSRHCRKKCVQCCICRLLTKSHLKTHHGVKSII